MRLKSCSSCRSGALWAAFCIPIVGPGTVYAQGNDDDPCSVPVHYLEYIHSAKELVEGGGEAGDVMRKLSCIAQKAPIHGFVSRSVPKAALRVGFAIAADDAARREFLLEIIGSQESSVGTHDYACELLVLVADDAARQLMLQQLKDTWPTEYWRGYFAFLREFGDPAFKKWLEDTFIANESESLPRALVEMQFLSYIDVLQKPETLITCIESDRDDLDGGWLVRQALRHGASKERIAEAVTTRMARREGKPDHRRLIRDSELVEECDKFGILGPEHEEDFRHVRKLLRSFHGHSGRLPWADEAIAAKRAAFYQSKSRKQDE